MLAQNFKRPTDLEITDAEFEALVKVLGMLERGELKHCDGDRPETQKIKMGFRMSTAQCDTACGTAGCIGGWAASVMGINPMTYVHCDHSPGLYSLYWGYPRSNVTPEQGAIALRNFLTHGEPRWAEARAG